MQDRLALVPTTFVLALNRSAFFVEFFSLSNLPLNCRSPIIHYTAMLLAILMASLSPFVHAVEATAVRITGTLVDADRNTPISLRTIYIADLSMLSFSHVSPLGKLRVHAPTHANNQASCDAPKVPYLAYTCSNFQGEFNLPVPLRVSGSYRLSIVGHNSSFKINKSNIDTDLGNLRISSNPATRNNNIAIVSLLSQQTFGNQDLANRNVTTAGGKLVSYLLDSEILAGYGLKLDRSANIEYYTKLDDNAVGKSIFDIERFSTILLKGSWSNIFSQYSPATINSMLQFVEKGGQLLIKDSRKFSNPPDKYTPYI